MEAVKPPKKSYWSFTFLCVITKGFGEQGFLIQEATSEEFHYQQHRDSWKSHLSQTINANYTAAAVALISHIVNGHGVDFTVLHTLNIGL